LSANTISARAYSVAVLWRGGELDTIWSFETEHDALGWIREKSAIWLRDQKKLPVNN
jgi:hypothetical protein